MITREPWSDHLSAALSVSGGHDLPLIIQQIKSGVAVLWHCRDEHHSGYIVTRLEPTATGCELCLVLGEGRGFDRFAPVFVEWARRKGWSFRTHVTSPALVRMWRRHGVELDEFVLRAKPDGR